MAYDQFRINLKIIPKRFKNIRNVVDVCGVKVYADLAKLPLHIIGTDGTEYTSVLTCIGREYPQGFGRLSGPEPEPEPDGKVDILQHIRNDAMIALDDEISGGFVDWILTKRPPKSEFIKKMESWWS